MRYRAGTCLLKLARVKAFDKALTDDFENIATLLMDPCEDVRHKFLLKLGETLPAQRLLPRWNMLPAFAALDPELENISLVS
jgi:sister-chromatid-cohesion protein PDS5